MHVRGVAPGFITHACQDPGREFSNLTFGLRPSYDSAYAQTLMPYARRGGSRGADALVTGWAGNFELVGSALLAPPQPTERRNCWSRSVNPGAAATKCPAPGATSRSAFRAVASVGLNVIQRQLGHANLGVTSVYLQGIDSAEVIEAVHSRQPPMISAAAARER